MTTHTQQQPRDRAEPLHICDAGLGADAAEYYDRVWHRDPDAYHQPGVCRHCGASLGSTPDDKVIPIGAFGYLPNVCCQNCSDAGKTRLGAEDQKQRASVFGGVVPAEFIWWDDARGNTAALAKVWGKFAFNSGRGLVIHGTSGTCKTRLMWEVVKKIVAAPEPFTWLFLDSYDCAMVGFSADAARVDYLFLDDLGNEPTSTKFETALLRLIRKRCDWHKPIFITTQLTGQQFKARFFTGTAAGAILRRLNERTDKIATDNVTQSAHAA